MTDILQNQPQSLEALCAEVLKGKRFKYLFFWGHQKPAAGGVNQSCMSQWYGAPFEVSGERYATAEHYMMAEKARLFGDNMALRKVLDARTPGAAKSAGREVAGFDENRWISRRSEIVVTGNMAKFSQNPALKAYLLQTGQRILVEASPVDKIWGIGLEAHDPYATDPCRWKGLNLLGFALMAVRQQLLKQPR